MPPKDKTEEQKTERFNMFMSPSEMTEIDEWAWKNRIRSKSEAVRRLVQIGLRTDRFAELYGRQAYDLSIWAYEDAGAEDAISDVSISAEKFNEIRHILVGLMVQLGRAKHYAGTPNFETLLENDERLRKLAEDDEGQEGDE